MTCAEGQAQAFYFPVSFSTLLSAPYFPPSRKPMRGTYTDDQTQHGRARWRAS
jgi:hypothetical protein